MSDIVLGSTENLLDKKNEAIDFSTLSVYKGAIVNVEKCFAVVLDKPFNDRYMLPALTAAALVKNIDGSFSDDTKERNPALSLVCVDDLITTLLDPHIISNVTVMFNAELPDFTKYFYNSDEVFQSSLVHSKIIIVFEKSFPTVIYGYKIPNKFVYLKTLVTLKNILSNKRNESASNSIIQNFMMTMNAIQGNDKNKNNT